MIHRYRQQGFSLVTALFLLVVLAALGAYMISISGTHQYITLYALQGERAYQAARSGVDWGIATTSATGTCPAATTLTLNGGLNGFRTSVTCTSTSHIEGVGPSFNIFVIEAFGETISPVFGKPGYASRRITAVTTNAP